MMLNTRWVAPWALAACIHHVGFASASSYGTSIGDLIFRDATFAGQGSQRPQFIDDLAHPSGSGIPSSQSSTATQNGNQVSKPMSSFSERIFRATFNDSGAGYNISLPGWLCADLPLGDWESPQGTQIVNGSIGDMYTQMRLPSKMLSNYTATRATALAASISETFSQILCEPIPNTGRALTYDGWRTQDIEGFWEAYVIGTAGVLGIGFVGLHLGIIHQGITANISLEQQVWILAATGALEFLAVTTVFRLQTNGFIPRTEAMVLNALWTIGEKIRDQTGPAWAGTCAGWSTFKEGINSMARQALTNLKIMNPDQMGPAGPSSLDLMSQVRDIETGHGGNAIPVIGEQCSSGS